MAEKPIDGKNETLGSKQTSFQIHRHYKMHTVILDTQKSKWRL